MTLTNEKKEKQTITILGAGSWGTALANVLAQNGHNVRIWGNDPLQIDEINQFHTNSAYLPNFEIPKTIKAYSQLAEAVNGADAILLVVPTVVIRSVAQQLAKVIEGRPTIIHASKGLELKTHLRISQILTDELDHKKRKGIVVLSGPSHAEEVIAQDLTTITAACDNLSLAQYVQELFTNEYFRVYTNDDVIGVELGAALKNIIALVSGVIHGLGYGDNAKAAIMTRGLAEISRLGIALGAKPLTFIGLSGVGDLIVTCTSIHSRNWRAGNLLGEGKELPDILKNMGMVVEGITTTESAFELAKISGVSMPITQTIYDILYNNLDVKRILENIVELDNSNDI